MARPWNVKTRIVTELRRLWRWCPDRQNAILNARLEGIRHPFQHRCEQCEGSFTLKEITVDHIVPVVPVDGWVDFNSFVKRLFCDVDLLQVLCKDCHKKKTKLENELRKINKPNRQQCSQEESQPVDQSDKKQDEAE